MSAREYARRYREESSIQAPNNFDNLGEYEQVCWWVELANTRSEPELLSAFSRYPQLAVEGIRTKRLCARDAVRVYTSRRERIKLNLCWIYGCRNDIVHEGRSKVPGAWTARRLITGYVNLTLRQTLAYAARGAVETPSEAFAMAQEIDQTVEALLASQKVTEALAQVLRV